MEEAAAWFAHLGGGKWRRRGKLSVWGEAERKRGKQWAVVGAEPNQRKWWTAATIKLIFFPIIKFIKSNIKTSMKTKAINQSLASKRT